MSRLILLAAVMVALPASAQPRLFAPADDARATLTARQAELLGHLETAAEAASVHLVRADLGALDAAAVAFNLAPDVAVTLSHARAEQGTYGVTQYFDRSDDDGTFAVLVVREGRITGNVRVAGQLYAVRPLTGGLHAVTRVDEGRLVDHAPEWEAVEAMTADRPEAPHVPHAVSSPEGGATVQRVLVPYTQNADNQVGDIMALIELAVAETNLAYDESNVSLDLVLAHAYLTPQNESSFSTTLSRMANPGDGYHDEIAGLRTQYGADMVNLIAGSAGGLCGQAYTIYADDANEAFAVTAQNCATGYYSFGHELGHLQGARHNPETDGSSSPFPYGHGKYWVAGGWRTTMSYACPGNCTRIPRWSNPDVLYNGTPLGDAALRDNARVLDETALHVAAFYPDPGVGTAALTVTRLSGSTVGANGGPMQFRLDFTNTSGFTFSGEYWVEATLPNGNPYNGNPIFGPTSLTLNNGQSASVTLTANVPRRAPAGLYTVTGYVGHYPGDVDDSDAFTFTKLASLTGGEDPDARLTVTRDDAAATAPAADASATTAALGTHPNPFTRTATVRYAVEEAGAARVAVYDVLGREVAVLVDGEVEAGTHAVTLDAQGLPSGVYLVRLTAGHTTATQRVTLAD